LIRAVHQVSRKVPCRLVIVGDGPERPSLETLATDLGMAALIHFTGYVTDPQRYYPLFDIFALSSDTEQMPYSVVEAMASGLPLAGTNVGDVALMVSKENSPFVVSPDDGSLAAAMYTLLREPDFRRCIGSANRRKAAKDFNENVMFIAYKSLFDGQLTP
jgi:glycosyltransferase involved in cell wall biosynthesis